MFWSLKTEPVALSEPVHPVHGRFILHRHQDAHGPHLDLRLEQDGCLVGWRIDDVQWPRIQGDGIVWAVSKGPHSMRWLDTDGEDAGTYTWLERSQETGVLLLQGSRQTVRITVHPEPGLPMQVCRSIMETLRTQNIAPDQACQLLNDGVTARSRAVARLIGLGYELEGSAFQANVWKKTLAGLSLDEIHAQLRSFEIRFDALYPPTPVSKPEALPEESSSRRTQEALAIVRK